MMTDDEGGRPEDALPEAQEAERDVIRVDDSGQSLEDILAEEETSTVEAAERKLAEVQRDLEDLKQRHLRKLADFENFRKRSEREKSDFFKFALSELCRELLAVLDNFERALAHAPEEGEFVEGVRLIYRQLLEALRKFGVSEVKAEGMFDPKLHEAVAREVRGDVAPQTILSVLQRGYYLNDRLLRPAMVKVAVAPGDERPEA
jgi:molecular chaperone GrpE